MIEEMPASGRLVRFWGCFTDDDREKYILFLCSIADFRRKDGREYATIRDAISTNGDSSNFWERVTSIMIITRKRLL